MKGLASGDRSPVSVSVVPTDLETFMALDFGIQRVGVAVGNRLTRTAEPRGTVVAAGDTRFIRIAQYVRDWQPDALVVGVPFHPDGGAHDNTVRARRFVRELSGRFKLPVFEVDERYTTTEALSEGAQDVDAVAAWYTTATA